MTGFNFPPLELPDTNVHYTIPGLLIAILTPYIIPIFNSTQFALGIPILITIVSYVITTQRAHHHHTHDSTSHKSKGFCFFGTYGTTILIQLLIQLNIINTTLLN